MSGTPSLQIGYLVNQYPKVSHSFIRREILALESQGIEVVRFAVRGWDADVVDPEDVHERTRTRYILEGGVLPLLLATITRAVRSPVRFLRSIALAMRMSRGSERPVTVHLAYLAEACLLLAWMERSSIRHIHAHFGTNPAELACLARELGGISYSFTVHGPEEFDKPAALHLGEKIRRASFVVGVSSFGASQLRRWVDASYWPRIEVVHCGLEEGFHRDAPLREITGSQLVCVGRLCEQKGQLLLVQAAADLARRGREFTLLLAGDGEMSPQIEASIAELGIAHRVRITGWISSDQVRSEILASRALVLPSFAEGLPVVIMEALALRRPVVSTFVAGIPELVQPDLNGWLVPAGDVVALAEAMEAVLLAPASALSEMGARGHERVTARHSVAVEARKLGAHFRKVIASAKP